MKTRICGALSCVSFVIAMLATPAYGISLDGHLGDWGVTPFRDWTPNHRDIDWVNGNGTRPVGSVRGGAQYDVEALYFTDDVDYIYFAMVSSYDQAGVQASPSPFPFPFPLPPLPLPPLPPLPLPFPFGPSSSGGSNYAGDLGISVDGAAGSEYGVDIRGIPTGSSQVDVMGNPRWLMTEGLETKMIDGTGTRIGQSSLFYRNAGKLEGDGTYTYILEGRIDKDIFGGLLTPGALLDLHYALTCGNDYLNLRADIDHGPPIDIPDPPLPPLPPDVPEPPKPPTEIPEPGTGLLLLTAGLLGLSGRRMKTKSKVLER